MSTQTSKLHDSRLGRPTDAAKHQAIIEAAARSFFSNGFAASSIEQIAVDAGVSKVTIYNHFGGKRALLSAAVEHECDKMRGYFAIDDLEGKSVRERLTAIGEGMVAFLSRREMVQFERRIAAETEHNPEIGMAFLEAGPQRMKQSFVAFLEWAQARGELDVPEPWLAAEQFASMCKGFGDLERRFGAELDTARNAQRIASAVDVFLKAYGPDNRTPE